MISEKYLSFAIFLCALFASAVYGYFIYSSAPKEGSRIFNSPDETANYFFAENFSRTRNLFIFDGKNFLFDNVIHPRSTIVYQGKFMPISFIGIIFFYGFLGIILGTQIIVYITPLFSAFGCFFYYLILKDIFGQKIAVLSSVLLLLFPVWAYYNGRSMYHNVLFVNFLIISLYFLLSYLKSNKSFLIVFSGFFLGLTLITRTSEVFWIIFIYLVIFITQRKKILMRDFILFLAFFCLGVWPFLFYNSLVYGKIFAFGYNAFEISSNAVSHEALNIQKARKIHYLFPFGFRILRSFYNIFLYYGYLFWWYALPLFIGLLFFFKDWKDESNYKKGYTIIFLLISLFLIFYYGSWTIVDSVDQQSPSIGISYARYWLPLYIFSIPFASIFLFWLVEKIKNKTGQKYFFGSLIAVFLILGIHSVWYKGNEGLFDVRQTIRLGYEKRERVSKLIPPNSIIIAERNDKTFFPLFQVIPTIKDSTVIEQLPKIMKIYPVYYYTYEDGDEIEKINGTLLSYGLVLRHIEDIYNNEKLFLVSKKEEDLIR